jgi:prepilin signal peptidase PulO-like enzyme (type II secretory pathway)
MMLVHLALGALAGLVAGEVSRGLAERRGRIGRPDFLSVGLAAGGSLALVVWMPVDSDAPTTVLRAALLLVLALVLASDLRERAVYPAIVYPAIVCLAVAAPLLGTSTVDALLGAAAAGGLFALLYVAARALYGPGALGEGDVSVAVLLGVVVGVSRMPLAILLVSLFGAGLALVAAVRARSLRASFAYAPALSLAALATSVVHVR